MPKFLVTRRLIVTEERRVEADNEDEAIELVVQGEGELVDVTDQDDGAEAEEES